MRALAPLLFLAAALFALWRTPAEQPLLGLSHNDFARGAIGVALLAWLTLSGLARAGPAGAARVFAGVALWALVGLVLVAGYAYRVEFGEIADRVIGELSPAEARVGPAGEVVIRRRLGDEFIVPAKVNGKAMALVFDTGASSVVLSQEDAAAAGLKFADDDYEIGVSTANGAATAAPTRLERVQIGPIVVSNVRALVARPGALRQSLLGMSFLERLKSFSVENGKLVLKGK
ncbi:MAG: TIGR02281 family clan AA aspartic protease [Pseudomonadota bacterium]|nr:TIGR02281 family clan AA aspartic protease [Pseudomonadota bacterium]